MGRKQNDKYANIASATVVESAAGTITFAEVQTGISLGSGVGMLIDKISYWFSAGTIADLVAAADYVQAGWFTSNQPASFSLSDRRIIDMIHLDVEPVIGTAASGGTPSKQPYFHDYTPPIVVAAPRLYLVVNSSSLAAAAVVFSRMYFRYIELTDKEYLEIAESFVLVG